MATTKKKAAVATVRKRARSKRVSRNGLFDAPAVKRAKKVVVTPRVKDKETGQLGTVIGVNGEWLKVKWDNRTKATLAKPSMLRTVNGGALSPPFTRRVSNKSGSKKRTIIKATVIKKVVVNLREPKWLRDITDAQLRKLRQVSPGEKEWIDAALKRRRDNQAKRRPPKGRTTNARATNPKPRAGSKAVELFETFQGREATKVTHEDVSPLAKGKPLYGLGKLVELKLRGYTKGYPVRKSKLLADTTNRLWISEKMGKPRIGAKVSDLTKIAEIEHLVYHAHKAHIIDKPQDYIHKLGEEDIKRAGRIKPGFLPFLYLDGEGYPVIQGGRYDIEDRGIVN